MLRSACNGFAQPCVCVAALFLIAVLLSAADFINPTVVTEIFIDPRLPKLQSPRPDFSSLNYFCNIISDIVPIGEYYEAL